MQCVGVCVYLSNVGVYMDIYYKQHKPIQCHHNITVKELIWSIVTLGRSVCVHVCLHVYSMSH